MKKHLALLLTFVMLFSVALTGCVGLNNLDNVLNDEQADRGWNDDFEDDDYDYDEDYSEDEEDYSDDYEDDDYDDEDEDDDDDLASSLSYRNESYDPDDTWGIYVYLCGTDLESEGGAATEDLYEMMAVELPENITFVIETGGTYQWDNDFVDPNYIQRHVYDSEGFYTVDEQELTSMGDPDTLADFLYFCEENYPADHKVFVFWNHGGGSVGGAECDEVFDYDALSLNEMESAFLSVYEDVIETGTDEEIAAKDPLELSIPYEIIGFDTCLMATVDTAKTFQKFGRYLVASEEVEPGNGWYYTGWVEALAEDPSMNGAQLGKFICDSFQEGCEMYGTDDTITLSVVDLIYYPKLDVAYNNVGLEALFAVCEDPSFLGEFCRGASRAENYGGNTPDEGYMNMIDLGHFIRNAYDVLPDSAQALLDALDECVVYKINGPYRDEATGLSCYYSLDGNTENFSQYTEVAASEAFTYLYEYTLYGEFGEEGYEYLSSVSDYTEVQDLETFEEELPITLTDDGYAVLEIGPDKIDSIQGVYFALAYYDEESELLFFLGTDNDLEADWENGIFTDRFYGTWASIDGHLVYMELTCEGEDYDTYSVPIKLNGKEYNLRVAYDYNLQEYVIMGASKGIEDSGMADKNLVKLKAGDEITTILYVMDMSDESDEEVYQVDVETFTIGSNPVFEHTELGDGMFAFMFETRDVRNQSLTSEVAIFICEDGEITVQ